MPKNKSPMMKQCIKHCLECHRICLEMSMNHCLETGGDHVEPEHFRLMVNCADICQTSANFMLSSSKLHKVTCEACAKVCEACAESCAKVGGMEECVEACRTCAESCKMSSE